MPPSTITKTVQTALDGTHGSVHMVRYIWFGTGSGRAGYSVSYGQVSAGQSLVYGKGVISNCILWSTLQVALLCTELLNEIQFSSVKVSTKSKHGGPVPVLN